jgi:acylphosphatase
VDVRAHVIFRGRVQGVFFRANAQDKAEEVGVLGWVRNLPDGTVELVAEGERARVEELLEWCRTGQPHARVESADVRWSEARGGFRSFEIRR